MGGGSNSIHTIAYKIVNIYDIYIYIYMRYVYIYVSIITAIAIAIATMSPSGRIIWKRSSVNGFGLLEPDKRLRGCCRMITEPRNRNTRRIRPAESRAGMSSREVSHSAGTASLAGFRGSAK